MAVLKASDTKNRRDGIVSLLQQQRDVRISDLSERFNVSVVTIRKDLDYLERNGLLKRVHGGAVSLRDAGLDYTDMRNIKRDEKQRIAAAAAALVQDGETILINSGSTCYYAANELKRKQDIFVITNSLPIMECFLSSRSITTFLLGGCVDISLRSTSGDSVVEQLLRYSVGKLFIGMDGVDPVAGATSYSHREDYIMHHMLAQSRQKILLADDSKIGKASFVKIADMAEFDILVTNETENNAATLLEIERMGVRVIRA